MGIPTSEKRPSSVSGGGPRIARSGRRLFGNTLLLLILAGLLPGCSGFAFKTFYRNLDTLLQARVDNYLALTDDQEEFLEGRIDAHYRWHRYVELPRYAEASKSLAERIESGLKKEDLEETYSQMRAFRIRLASRIYPDALKVLKDFDPGLIEEQRRLMEEYNEDLAEKAASPAASRFARRLESNVEFFEFFLGDLNASQKDRIRRYTSESADTTVLYLLYRKQNQKRMISILRKGKAGHEELEDFLKQYMFNWESLYPPSYRNAVNRNRVLFYQVVLDLDRGLSKSQRQYASTRLQELATNFLELAGKQ
ncbi:MAG: hypothetical protein KDK25_09035 [Leptospiraceae bacterium]|nr:hypothetical protein [Leptospiraceae bacterium]